MAGNDAKKMDEKERERDEQSRSKRQVQWMTIHTQRVAADRVKCKIDISTSFCRTFSSLTMD